MANYFEELAAVDCSAHVEKKGRFTYLSWPFAMSELAKRHPDSEIEVREWDGFPGVRGPRGWMVHVSVTIKGVKRSQWHPVLDGANKPIPEPSVFDFNTSIQRATVKAIALHGLGLYIYAGEDLPESVAEAADKEKEEADRLRAADFKAALEAAADETELARIAKELSGSKLPAPLLSNLRALYSEKRKAVTA